MRDSKEKKESLKRKKIAASGKPSAAIFVSLVLVLAACFMITRIPAEGF
jgi:hypothetical protein